MKKIILLGVLIFCGIINLYAMGIKDHTENVKGPVKVMTVTSNQTGIVRVWKYWYDSIGRLTESVVYHDGKIMVGYVRQYTINNAYMDYEYNQQGLIKGSFTQTQLDSLGNKISVRFYRDGKLFRVDSIIYNDQGQMVENYLKKDSVFKLRFRCEYDSLHRLTMHYCKNTINNEITKTYEYLPDGSYIEHESSTDYGKRPDKKYIFNNQGQLIEIKGKEEHSRFRKFDKYGNWTVWTEVLNIPIGHFEYTYTREIEYYE